MIYITNPLALPLMLLIWTIDMFLLLSGIRLILGQVDTRWAKETSALLIRLTDPVPDTICGWLSRRRRPVPIWLPWMVIFLAAIVTRHLLIWAVISMT